MFGRLATDACAESLAYGPIAIDNEECSDVFLEYPGFISTESGEQGTCEVVASRDGRSGHARGSGSRTAAH